MSVKCRHEHGSLVRTWAGGTWAAVGQCDNCGALLNPGDTSAIEVFVLPEVDRTAALLHARSLDGEVKRLETILAKVRAWPMETQTSGLIHLSQDRLTRPGEQP